MARVLLGMPAYGCTRKVKAVHKGPAKFSNAYP